MMEMTARQGLLYEITAETWEDRVAHFGDQEYGQPTQTLQLIHWRGGILQETWKRSGARDAVSSYRSLFVSSIAGKGVHKLFRARAQDTTSSALHDFHLGARPKAPVLLPALYVQTFFGGKKPGATAPLSSSWTPRVPTT